MLIVHLLLSLLSCNVASLSIPLRHLHLLLRLESCIIYQTKHVRLGKGNTYSAGSRSSDCLARAELQSYSAVRLSPKVLHSYGFVLQKSSSLGPLGDSWASRCHRREAFRCCSKLGRARAICSHRRFGSSFYLLRCRTDSGMEVPSSRDSRSSSCWREPV